ncbi:sulfite exporter TauE/SafE family protein [Candidatus Bathyarchaeota archaeon]|nr:sulfite exporter TauE/SafE family protein [Candidatus Bathyarchaeota archaeon]
MILAIASCSIGAIAGFAGGVLMLPIFAIILIDYGFELVDIIGSNAVGTIFTGLIATLLNLKRKEIHWFLGIIFVIPIFAGNYLGAYITTLISENTITTLFAILIIFLAILMFLKWISQKISQNLFVLQSNDDPAETTTNKPTFFKKLNSMKPFIEIKFKETVISINLIVLIILGLVIGTISGLVGLGCGWAVPPLLILLYNIPAPIAISTALFMTTLSLTVNGIIHVTYGHFSLWLWVLVASCSIVGGLFGTFLKRKFKASNLIIFISSIMIIISILLLVKTWTDFY